MSSNLFKLHGSSLGDEDLSNRKKTHIMEQDEGEVLKIQYRELSDYIK